MWQKISGKLLKISGSNVSFMMQEPFTLAFYEAKMYCEWDVAVLFYICCRDAP
jgi:hypothetical protein